MKATTQFVVSLVLALSCHVSAMAGTVWCVDFAMTVEEVTDQAVPPYFTPTVGEKFFGNFRYDDTNLSGEGLEVLYSAPPYGFPDFPLYLLDTTLNIRGSVYHAEDGYNTNDYAALLFQDGILSGLNLIIVLDQNGGSGAVEISPGGLDIRDGYGGNLLARGQVTYSEPTACEIPTPAAAWTGMAMLGLLGVRRRYFVA